MKEKYPHAVIGHSDHTPDIYTLASLRLLWEQKLLKNMSFWIKTNLVRINPYQLILMSWLY